MVFRIRRPIARLVCLLHGGHTFDPDEWEVEHHDDSIPGLPDDILWMFCGVCGRPWWSMPLDAYPDADQIRDILDGFEPSERFGLDRAVSGFRLPSWVILLGVGALMWWALIRLVRWVFL